MIGYVQATIYPDARADIAYELSRPFWGRGLAREAIEALIAEIVERYHVRSLSAVLKRENHRSLRLLERLEFSLASPELHARYFGTSERFWLNLQIRFDIETEKDRLGGRLAAEVTVLRRSA